MSDLLPRNPFTEPVLMITASGFEMRECGGRYAKVAVNIHVEGAEPLLLAQHVRRVDRILRRHVVDQDVQSTEPMQCSLDGVSTVVGIGQVPGNQLTPAAFRGDQVARAPCVLVLRQVRRSRYPLLLWRMRPRPPARFPSRLP